jgi:xanthine dehydrogenase YagS FAD-binding subunit
MRALLNVNAKDFRDAASLLKQNHDQGKTVAIVGGGSDLLGLVKEQLVPADVLVNLKAIHGMDQVAKKNGEVILGGLTTLDTLNHHPLIQTRYKVLAEAAGSVATPQIRNVGTIAGNLAQRPWCWYFRNGFPCFKNGGKTCFSVTGENDLHAIFGGGPSYIVHPSDTAPALVALGAKFRIIGPSAERTVAAEDFFTAPRVNPARENVLANDEILAEIHLPAPGKNTRSTYHKELDREAWTHAIVSVALVLEMDKQTCRSARVVLGGVAPIPWRLKKVEALLAGQKITDELAAKAAETALEGAQPLAKNKYKIPLTKAIVKRNLIALANA